MARSIRFLIGGPLLLLGLFQSSVQGSSTELGHEAPLGLAPVFGFDDGVAFETLPPRVEHWIRRYLTEDRDGFEQLLIREGAFRELVREKLAERGMPDELRYAAMVESGFLVSARSDREAMGLWQFLGATARAYGLTVDGWVDERRDPILATDAALDYLAALHDEFGSWMLAIAAYNAGPARVHRSLAAAGIPSPVSGESAYWRIEADLPFETREHVAKILATSLLSARAGRFGISVTEDPPLRFDLVLVPPGTSLIRVARVLGSSPEVLRALNPHLVVGQTPPGRSYPMRVPEGRGAELLDALS